jgi:GcrA cell cycle regulator
VSGPVSKYGEDVLAEIASLWADKVTTAEIGRRLNMPKNSVCGMARSARLKGDPRFPERGLQAPRGPRRVGRGKAPPDPVSALVLVPARPRGGPLRVFELEAHHCRYAVISGTARGDHWFCAKPKQVGSPYCAEHHALCNPPLVYRPRLARRA